jgi:hypothetical protein
LIQDNEELAKKKQTGIKGRSDLIKSIESDKLKKENELIKRRIKNQY